MSQDAGLSFGLLFAAPQLEAPSGIPEDERILEEQTQSMIEEAAYYLAEKRGFAPGYALDDWLQAKQQIEVQLQELNRPTKKKRARQKTGE